MSKTLLLILSVFAIVSFSQCLNQKNSQKGHGSLYYYHKFEKKHGWTPNANIPLGTHYNNEKMIRKHLYKLEARVQHMRRQEGFKERDLKRAILADQNKLATNEAVAKADNRLHNQKEEAIKEGINHNEKFKEKYQKRFLKNHDKLAHANPDQEAEFLELENFDQSRVDALKADLANEQQRLNKQKRLDMESKGSEEQKNSHLEGQIGQEQAALKSLRDSYTFKLVDMEGQIEQLKEMVDAEANLDAERVNTEQQGAEANQA